MSKLRAVEQIRPNDQLSNTEYDAFCQNLAMAFNELPKQLKVIGRFVMDHPNHIALETAAEIARKLDLPPSGLIRFAQALGFDGFSSIQSIFRDRLRAQLPDQPMSYGERIARLKADDEKGKGHLAESVLSRFVHANTVALEQLWSEIDFRQFDKAVKLLQEARHIYVFGLRRSFPGAAFTYYTMEQLHLPVFLVDSVGGMHEQQLRNMGKGDVFLAITFPVYSPEILDATRAARGSGAKVIALTDNEISPVNELADIAFFCDRITVAGFRSNSATLCLAQTLSICAGAGTKNQKSKRFY